MADTIEIHPIVSAASVIAQYAHRNQKRKWGEQAPYITHPQWCANKARELGCGPIVQAAMWLHDVIEDIAIPENDIEHYEKLIADNCGIEVLHLCWELTNVSDTPEWMAAHPNPRRYEKWQVNLAHLKEVSDSTKLCKMIDRLHNVRSMVDAPRRMKEKYVPESRELLQVCRHTNTELADELQLAINELEESI